MSKPTENVRRKDKAAPWTFREHEWREALQASGISGPWDNEPDRDEWRHAGMPCLAQRGRLGNWCGYVAVPPGHPAYLKHYDHVDVKVHGGLTHAGPCSGLICHVPQKGETDAVYWLGFDCAHAGDESPSMIVLRQRFDWPKLPSMPGWAEDSYKTLHYVKAEVNKLAEQLADMGKRRPWYRVAADHVRGRAFKEIYRTRLYHRIRHIYWWRATRALQKAVEILHAWALKIRLRFVERR